MVEREFGGFEGIDKNPQNLLVTKFSSDQSFIFSKILCDKN